jgi:hypothetical protein
MAKRYTRNKRRNIKGRRNMKGGALSQGDIQQLTQQRFSTRQIQTLQDLGVSLNEIMQKVNIIMNQEPQIDPDYMTEQVIVELFNENIFQNATNQIDAIPHAIDDIHDIDINGSIDESFNSQGTMNLNELSRNSDSGYTTNEDRSLFDEFGGKRRRISRKNNRNKRRTNRRNNKRKLTLKGGMCFGRGVGANSYDPNYSIYNTDMLKLFPYKS